MLEHQLTLPNEQTAEVVRHCRVVKTFKSSETRVMLMLDDVENYGTGSQLTLLMTNSMRAMGYQAKVGRPIQGEMEAMLSGLVESHTKRGAKGKI